MATILLAVYGLTLIIIALTSLKFNDTMENYLIAGRSQKKLFVVASMMASTIGGGLTLGSVTKTWNMGFPAFWLIAAGALAHYLQGLLLSAKVRETEALTMPDMANKLVGPSVQKLTSVIILVTWTGIATAQFVAATSIVADITKLAYPAALMVVGVFLVVYTLIGGQKSVIRTDFFQFGILAVSLLFTVAWLFTKQNPGNLEIRIDLFTEQFRPTSLLYYIIVMGGSYFICPMMFTRILSSDTAATARKSSYISAAGMIFFAVVITAIGLWAKAMIPALNGAQPLNLIAANYLPKFGGGLLIFGLLSAILSTADTVLLTAAGSLQKDIIGKDSVAMVRVWVVAISIVAAVIALFYKDIIGIIMKTYNGYTAGIVPALLVAILYAGKKRMNERLTFVAIVVGYALGLAGSFMQTGSFAAQILPLIGLASSALLSLLAIRFPGISGKNAA